MCKIQFLRFVNIYVSFELLHTFLRLLIAYLASVHLEVHPYFQILFTGANVLLIVVLLMHFDQNEVNLITAKEENYYN